MSETIRGENFYRHMVIAKLGHMAYFWVQSLAWSLYFFLSVLYKFAISGTNGSSGFGSVNSDVMESRTTNEKQTECVKKQTCTYFLSQYHW